MNFKRYHVSRNLFPQSSFSGKSYGVMTNFNTASEDIVFESGQYTFSCDISTEASGGIFKICFTYTDDTQKKTGWISSLSSNIQLTSDTGKIVKSITITDYNVYTDIIISNIMLNTGSTALPYEPYSSEVWHNTPHYIHNTSTDTITTLPAVIYPTDTTATVGLKGQAVQSGTPTPDNPVMPNGTGERTGNLWNNRGFSATTITLNYTHNISNNYGTTLSTTEGDEVTITQSAYPTGNVGYQNGFFMIDVDFSKYAVGDVVTISFDYIVNEIHALSTQTATTVYAGKNSNTVPATLSSGDWKISGRLTAVITIIADMNPYVEVRLCGNSITLKNIMLNTGSTALPYEPYGYKIPILSANTTTPVYLGEVETERKIVKYEFTGNEAWDRQTPEHSTVINLYCPIQNAMPSSPIYCNIAEYDARAGSSNDAVVNIGKINSAGTNLLLDMVLADYNTTGVWKKYLQQQYAAGTPVTVWYVLSVPETAVVNEPLRKIGDYADTVSGITIPTTAGANTISVDTTLQPSEVTVNYKGWHPVQSVHERENGAWT